MPIFENQNGQIFYQSSSYQPPYPVDCFPALIGQATREVATGLRVPTELAAHAALGAVSLVCQRFINIQCPPYDPASVSLFLMAVSNSSKGKSIAERRFLRAVVSFEHTQAEAIEAMMSDYRAEMKIWKDDGHRLAREYREAQSGSVEAAEIRAQRLQHERDCPVKPQKWELRYEEMSPAGLRDALVDNHAVGILSSEAGPALNGMTFSEPAVLSGYWSGEDRPVGLSSGNRRPVEPRLTISLMTQEDRFELFMKSRGSDAFGTGLLGRFLFAFPKTFDWPGEPTQIEELPEPRLDLFNARVAEILSQALPAPHERLTLKLSAGAKDYWKWFKDAVHNDLICGNYSEDMKFFFRKIGQQATRIAALFHYFGGDAGDISPEAMKSAIALCEWYLLEFIRVFSPYAPSQQQQDAVAAQKLLQWLQEAVAEPWHYPKLTQNRYTERDLRNFSSIRNNPKMLERAINILCSQGSIAVYFGKKGGRVICYPRWILPDPALVNYPHPGQAAQSNFNNSLDGIAAMNWNNQNFSTQQWPSGNGPVNNGFSSPANTPDQKMNVNRMELDSEEVRAIKLEAEKRAMDTGVGPVNLSIQYRKG